MPGIKNEVVEESCKTTNEEIEEKSKLFHHVLMPKIEDSFLPPVFSIGGSTGRFGSMNRHRSFFSRHNPHPNRVKHMPGLLGLPICTVNDDGYFANARYSLTFPPIYYNQQQVRNMKLRMAWLCRNNRPATTDNQCFTGSEWEPSWSTGKPWRTHVIKERAVPTIGLVPVHEVWQDELLTLTEALQQDFDARSEKKKKEKKTISELFKSPVETRTRSTQYSAQTGRLIPSSSRQLASRRQRQTNGTMVHTQHLLDDRERERKIDMEGLVLQLMGQILQTEDPGAVQDWLVSAPERDKVQVLEWLKVAIGDAADAQPSNTYNLDYSGQILPAIGGNKSTETRVDRLILEEIEDNCHDGDSHTNNVTSKMAMKSVKIKHTATVQDAKAEQHCTSMSNKKSEDEDCVAISDKMKAINPENKSMPEGVPDCNSDTEVEKRPKKTSSAYCKVHGRRSKSKERKKHTKNDKNPSSKPKSLQISE